MFVMPNLNKIVENRKIYILHCVNRTEFIREAIREKLISIERDLVIHELRKFKGTANVSVSDKRLHKIREEVANKYARKLGVKLD